MVFVLCVFVRVGKRICGKSTFATQIPDNLDNLATDYMTGWSEPASLVGPPLSTDDLLKKEQQQRQHCWWHQRRVKWMQSHQNVKKFGWDKIM